MNKSKHSKQPQNGVKVTLADLKRLGKLGNVTACLTDGSLVELGEHYALKESSAYINPQQGIDAVKVIVLYTDLYDNIRTIKHNNELIARKGKKYLEFVSQK